MRQKLFPNNLAWYLKSLNLLSLNISGWKSVISSFEENHNFLVFSGQFELYSMRLYIGITKCKSSASSVVVPSNLVINLVKGSKPINVTCAACVL